MTKLSAILATGLRFIRSRQLPSGEVLCQARIGADVGYCPFPFWSAIAHHSLAFADPASSRFDRRVLDLLRAGDRRDAPAMVSATRWRIRTYLASEEEPGCVWRMHGRHSASDVDAATSACAAESLLLPPSLDARAPLDRHSAPLERLLDDETTPPAGRCHVLGYLSCAGASRMDIPAEIRRVFLREKTRPLATLFAAARALRLAGVARHSEDCAEIEGGLLRAAVSTPLHAAMQLSGLADCEYDGPELPERVEAAWAYASNLAAWESPACPPEEAESAGATLALMLSALFRASATAGGGMSL